MRAPVDKSGRMEIEFWGLGAVEGGMSNGDG